jgi:drug/metabolite transporter (DMT)-like permease
VSATSVDVRQAGRRTSAGILALVGVTAVWGSTFPLSKDLLTRVPVTDYLALRFLVAAAAIAVARPGTLRRIDGRVLRAGIGLGLCYSAGQTLQFFGLPHTAATVSAFVVSMYVVVTPLLGAVLLRARPGGWSLVATGLAAAGVATMSLRGWSLGFGEALTLAAAVLYALHILGLSRWSTARTAYPLTFVQLLTIGLSLLAAAASDGVHVPGPGDLAGFLYLSVIAGAGAMSPRGRPRSSWCSNRCGRPSSASSCGRSPSTAGQRSAARWSCARRCSWSCGRTAPRSPRPAPRTRRGWAPYRPRRWPTR